MNQFNHTEKSIKENIDQVFQEVQKEFIENYFVSGNGDFSNLQNELNHNLAIKITNKKILLIDTILNYLTDDAIKNLEGYENKVVNNFYTQNQYWQQEIKNKFQESDSNNSMLSLSDTRLAYSAASGIAGSIISGLIWKMIFKREDEMLTTIFFTVFSGVAVATFTYYNTKNIAMQNLKKEVMQYLEKSKAQVQEELNETIQIYRDKFNQFLSEHT